MILRITMEDKREDGENIENQFNCGSVHVFELKGIEFDNDMDNAWNKVEDFLRDSMHMACKSMECSETNA